MNKKYFVIFNTQKGVAILPMVDRENVMMTYATFAEATNAAKNTFYGQHFGFEVFKLGDGVLAQS